MSPGWVGSKPSAGQDLIVSSQRSALSGGEQGFSTRIILYLNFIFSFQFLARATPVRSHRFSFQQHW